MKCAERIYLLGTQDLPSVSPARSVWGKIVSSYLVYKTQTLGIWCAMAAECVVDCNPMMNSTPIETIAMTWKSMTVTGN